MLILHAKHVYVYTYISKKANNKYAIKFGDKGRATKIVCLKIALLHATQE